MLVVLAATPALTRAQADVIRGRVTNDRSQPVDRALVTATSTAGGVARTATTGSDGRFTITFPNGDGDYWIDIAAIGYLARRLQVRRLPDQEILVADARLTAAGNVLDPVTIEAPRPRGRPDTSSQDIGGGDRRINTELLTTEQLNDLALLASMLPGVQIIPAREGEPSAFSVFGIGADQNLTTLNGLPFGGTALPRDANFEASASTSPYDVSRGGFSGAQLALRSRAPTNLTLRANSFALDAPWLQWSDRTAQSLGQDFTNFSAGGVLTQPLRRDRLFAHLAYQASRRSSDLRTLLDIDADAIRAAGVAEDSLERFVDVMSSLGIPGTLQSIPRQRRNEQALIFGSLDLMPSGASGGAAVNLTFSGGWNRFLPMGVGVTSVPSRGGTRETWNGTAQLRHVGYAAAGVLSETQVGIAGSRADGSSYLSLPAATVRINSSFDDGALGVALLGFGGNPALDQSRGSTGVAAMNQLSWFSRNNEHRLKLTTELSRESLSERMASNTLGTFQFNSLADLEAGTPAVFRRQLVSPSHAVSHYVGAVSLGDAYVPVPGPATQLWPAARWQLVSRFAWIQRRPRSGSGSSQ